MGFMRGRVGRHRGHILRLMALLDKLVFIEVSVLPLGSLGRTELDVADSVVIWDIGSSSSHGRFAAFLFFLGLLVPFHERRTVNSHFLRRVEIELCGSHELERLHFGILG